MKKGGGKTTLRDIAREAGVSVYTVSCALRGQSQVAAATRERICRLAAEMGYEPDPVAAMLSHRKRREGRGNRPVALAATLGPNHEEWSMAFREESRSLGYQAELIDPRDFRQPERASDRLWNRGVQGIFLRPFWGIDMECLQQFDWSRFAVIKSSRQFDPLCFDLIRHSPFDYAMHALRRVFAKGYRRVAVILSHSSVEWDDDARVGAVLSFAARHLPAGGSLKHWDLSFLPLSNPGDSNEVREACREVGAYRPDAVLAFPWVWYYAMERNSNLFHAQPYFAAIIAPERRPGVPQIPGCAREIDKIARQGVQLLHRALLAGDRGMSDSPQEHVIEPRWLEASEEPAQG